MYMATEVSIIKNLLSSLTKHSKEKNKLFKIIIEKLGIQPLTNKNPCDDNHFRFTRAKQAGYT